MTHGDTDGFVGFSSEKIDRMLDEGERAAYAFKSEPGSAWTFDRCAADEHGGCEGCPAWGECCAAIYSPRSGAR